MPDRVPDASTRRFAARALAAALLLALVACGDDDEARSRDRQATDGGQVSGLPAPEGAIGSVTGMPAHPGPGTTPMAGMPEATLGDVPAAGGGDVPDSELTWIEDPDADGIFVLTDDPGAIPEATPAMPTPPAPSSPPAAQSPVAPRIAVIPPPAPADPSRPVPVGTEGATESTTFVVDPDARQETDD